MGSTFCGWESHQQSGRSTLSVTRPCWASSIRLCALLIPFQDSSECEDPPHGCCSDGVTAASGPSGQGCPTSSTLISECLSVSLSVCPSVCPFQCLSVSLSVCPSVCPFQCLSVCLCGCRPVRLPDCLAVASLDFGCTSYLCLCLVAGCFFVFVCLSVCLIDCMSVSFCLCLFLHN